MSILRISKYLYQIMKTLYICGEKMSIDFQRKITEGNKVIKRQLKQKKGRDIFVPAF